jgi:hypothetical protein
VAIVENKEVTPEPAQSSGQDPCPPCAATHSRGYWNRVDVKQLGVRAVSYQERDAVLDPARSGLATANIAKQRAFPARAGFCNFQPREFLGP